MDSLRSDACLRPPSACEEGLKPSASLGCGGGSPTLIFGADFPWGHVAPALPQFASAVEGGADCRPLASGERDGEVEPKRVSAALRALTCGPGGADVFLGGGGVSPGVPRGPLLGLDCLVHLLGVEDDAKPNGRECGRGVLGALRLQELARDWEGDEGVRGAKITLGAGEVACSWACGGQSGVRTS